MAHDGKRLRSEVTENHRVIVNKTDRGVVGDLDPDMVGVSLLTAGDHKISGAILNLLRDMVFPANRDMSASIITRVTGTRCRRRWKLWRPPGV